MLPSSSTINFTESFKRATPYYLPRRVSSHRSGDSTALLPFCGLVNPKLGMLCFFKILFCQSLNCEKKPRVENKPMEKQELAQFQFDNTLVAKSSPRYLDRSSKEVLFLSFQVFDEKTKLLGAQVPTTGADAISKFQSSVAAVC